MSEQPQLHLVGGFLGSGKTTAIINACKLLARKGKRAGVVTNDQGKYLVDTAFFRLEDVPALEVGGGCFCCNYSDLEKQLTSLIETARPDVIFAESVGSCADLVATVVQPLIQLQGSPLKPTSFSVFADVRMLSRRVQGEELPFSEDVQYIFDKQIEESGLVVVNKMDLLPAGVRPAAVERIQAAWPDKRILPQVSTSPEGVLEWLDCIENGRAPLAETGLEIDYQRYGEGEQQLAWLDEEVVLETAGQDATALARQVIAGIMSQIDASRAPVGHVKFIVQGSEAGEAKISFTSMPDGAWEAGLPELRGEQVRILINARVELAAADLAQMADEVLAGLGWQGTHASVNARQAFHPGFPKPEHRLAG